MWWLALLWTAAAVLVFAALVQRRVPAASLFLDPATTTSARAWSGLVSELGRSVVHPHQDTPQRIDVDSLRGVLRRWWTAHRLEFL